MSVKIVENTAGAIRITFSSSFSAHNRLTGVPFYATTEIEFVAHEFLLDFESFEAYLMGFSQEAMTLEESCRKIYDELMGVLFPLSLRVQVEFYTPTHGHAIACLERAGEEKVEERETWDGRHHA